MAFFFRVQVTETDLSGFVRPIVDETGAMVGDFEMGPGDVPAYCQSDSDSITLFGYPNAEKWANFEAIPFVQQAPLWQIRAIGANAKYAGVDVIGGAVNQVVAFGPRTGRDYATFNPSSVSTNQIDVIGTGDGVTALYTGTLSKTPITSASFRLYNGATRMDASESGGAVSGTDATGTLNLSNGAYALTYSGTAGSVAEFLGTIDLSGGVDLSVFGAKPKAIKLIIDQSIYDNINLGNSPTTTSGAIVSAINTAVGYTAASMNGNFIEIVGQLGSSTLGQIIIAAPTDTMTYDSGVNLVFAPSPAVLTATTAATDPTGAIPRAGQQVSVDFIYTQNLAASLQFSVFAFSPYNDSHYQLAASIANTGGSKYTLTLYQNVPNKGLAQINTWNFSMIREKDSYNRQLYYKDVFKYVPYVKLYVNPAYTANPVVPTNSTAQVLFTGGYRGDNPQPSDFNTAWSVFQRNLKYPAKIFMDIYGGYENTVANIIQNYQRYSMGLTMVPPGNNAQGAILYRNATGIDYDHMAIYTNWATIRDPYNNSYAFISQIGAAGAKWAQMQRVFDGLAPAGENENGLGGQLEGFQVVEMESDVFNYTETDLFNLDNAGINPIINDPIWGPTLMGQRTMQVRQSDTSYIHTRRLYNYILDNIERQVLRSQVFKLNDPMHQLKVKTNCEAIVNPLVDAGLLQIAIVVCGDGNNTGEVKEQRVFKVDIYVQATPTSEVVQLNLIRLPQSGQVLTQILSGVSLPQ